MERADRPPPPWKNRCVMNAVYRTDQWIFRKWLSAAAPVAQHGKMKLNLFQMSVVSRVCWAPGWHFQDVPSAWMAAVFWKFISRWEAPKNCTVKSISCSLTGSNVTALSAWLLSGSKINTSAAQGTFEMGSGDLCVTVPANKYWYYCCCRC